MPDGEVVVFPDVEALLVTALTASLAARGRARSVATKVPNPRPARFVRLLRTGGLRMNVLMDAATITVEAWEPTEAEAARTAQLVRGLVHALDDLAGAPVFDVGELAGPQNYPDPATASVRYVATYQITVGAAPA